MVRKDASPARGGFGVQGSDRLMVSRRSALLGGAGLLAAALAPTAAKGAGADPQVQTEHALASGWELISGSLKHVSVAPNGSVWGVNVNDDIYRRSANQWFQESGSLKQISVGSGALIWGVNTNDMIYRRANN